VSKADTVRNCPRKFKYQYIDKIKGLRAPKEIDALVGKAAHKLLEYAVSLGRPANQFAKGILSEFGLEGESADRFLALIPAADKLSTQLAGFPQKHATLPPKTEQKIAVSLEGKAVDFFDNAKGFFRGVLDLSYRVKNKNHLIIMDHKTGKYRGLSYYQSQFDGYLWLVKGLYPELEGVQVAVNYLQTGQTEFAPFKYVHDAGELGEHVVAFLNKATAKVQNLEAVKPGPLCPWCDFHSICPAHTADGNHGEENSYENGKGVNP
jgi:hypothetical protein